MLHKLYLSGRELQILIIKMKSIGELLKELRAKKGLFVREAAAGVKIVRPLLTKFETGSRIPSKKHVVRLAKFYGVSANELLIASMSDKIAGTLRDEKDIAPAILQA